MQITLQDRRALVTGGGSGIGAAIARQLSAAGARVAVNWDVDPDGAAALAAELGAGSGRALAVAADVSDAGQVGEMRPGGRVPRLRPRVVHDRKPRSTWTAR